MTPAAQAWFDKAEFDFSSAGWLFQAPPPPNFDLICFLCQQCTEKLLKAVLTDRSATFPYVHDLEQLGKLVEAAVPGWTSPVADLALLQPGAVLVRYPGWSASAQDASDYHAACQRLRALILPLL
jgi:HEPN domain-containing protein